MDWPTRFADLWSSNLRVKYESRNLDILCNLFPKVDRDKSAPLLFLYSYSPCFSRYCLHLQNRLPPKTHYFWCSRHFYRLGCYRLVHQHEPSALEVAKLWHKFVAVLHQVHSLFKTSHPNFLYSCDGWDWKKTTAEGPASVWNVNCGEPTWIDENSQPGNSKVGTNILAIFKESLSYQKYSTNLQLLYRYTTQKWVELLWFSIGLYKSKPSERYLWVWRPYLDSSLKQT